MTITCKYSELRSALQGLTEAGTYQIIITDPQNIVLGSSSIAGTIGNSIKQYTIGHINHNIYIDLSTSDLSKALLYSPSISYSFAECAQLVAVGKLTNISSTPNYSHLFDGCSALTNADISNLVYTDDSVFTDIFKGCTSLTVLTICKAFVNKTQAERNLLQDCTALRQIIVADSIHPALINKDTGINGDIIVTGSSYTKGQAIFANDVAVAGPIVGTGALKRDDQGQLIQVNNKEYSRADTLTNEAKHIDSFIGNATSASELNHDIDIDVQGEITGHLTVKTYEKDGETFVRNVLKTDVNSLNAIGVDNNYKLVTKDYLAQELSKINSAMMLKVDRITDTQYELDGQLYNPQAHVIYLVPKANDLNPDDSDSYDEYIWKVDYELFTESSTSTGILETVNRPNGQKVTLVTANISNIDTINDVKYFSYDGFSFSIPGNTEHIIDAKTKTYTVTSGNANKIQNVDVINSNNIVFTTEGQITYTAFEENNTVKVKVEQDTIESVNIITSDNSQVMYSITETTENFRPAGTPNWERIGNTDIDLSDYLRTSELRNGFNFNGDVSTTRNLTVNGDTTLDNTTIGNIFEVNNDQQKINVSAPLNIQKDDDEHINIEDNIINVFGEASKTTISADNITIGEQTRGASDRTVITKTGISSTNINTKEIKLSNGNMDYTICLDDAGNFNIISESGSPDIAINGKKVAYQSDIDRIILSGGSGGSNGSGDSYIITDFDEETCEELKTNMGIKSVKVANGITEIPDNAFEGCRGIISIEIPESVTYIGSDAFSDCVSLKDINLPEISTISSNMFKNCQSLKRLNLPDSILNIEESAFENSGLIGLIFSKNIIAFGSNIINNCNNLSYIKYKGTSFEWSENILKAEDWKGNIDINIQYNYITDFSQFIPSSDIQSIEIAKNVSIIPDNAFNGCCNLRQIDLPDSIISIGSNAFSDCESLKSLVIPKNVKNINYNTFDNSSISTILVDENNQYYSSDDTQYVLYNKDKTKIIIILNKDLIFYNIPETVTSIEGSAFSNCNNLTTIEIPDSVTSIGSGAFQYCTNLTSIALPETLTTIGASAFQGCTSLTEIIIPEGITFINAYSFNGCRNLTEIIIPNGVTNIQTAAFADCPKLFKIVIPESVTFIESSAFNSSENVTLYYRGSQEQWNNITIQNLWGWQLNWNIQYNYSD